MKKDCNQLTDLFRNRLGDDEMEVRDNLWGDIQSALPAASPVRPSSPHRTSFRFQRIAAAASLVLVLAGAASAVYWYSAHRQRSASGPAPLATVPKGYELNGDKAPEMTVPDKRSDEPLSPHLAAAATPGTSSSRTAATTAGGGRRNPAIVQASQQETPVRRDESADDDERVTVTMSITITERVYANNGQAAQTASDVTATPGNKARQAVEQDYAAPRPRNWAVKFSAGTSLPRGDYHMPLSLTASVERRLGKVLSVEAGLQYNYFPIRHTDNTHSIAVPVQLNATLLASNKVDLYALAGAKAEIPGETYMPEGSGSSAPDLPLVWSVKAGVGVRYKFNQRLSLFAEANLSHHFGHDGQWRYNSLTAERQNNLNLLCGLRMTY